MDPIPAVGLCLLLRQCCLKQFPDPAGFNSRRGVAVGWESRQPSCRSDHVLQRVIIMTQGYWHVLGRGRGHLGRPHHSWLNKGSRRGRYDPWRVTGPRPWRVEEVAWIVNQRESRLGLLMPPSQDLIGRVLIHRERRTALESTGFGRREPPSPQPS